MSEYLGRLAWPVRPGAFRLFLALLVFVHHCSSFAIGETAVFVFFVLSGYWVHMMWKGRYINCAQPYSTYIISRLWRLMPVFVLANLVTTPLLLHYGTLPEGMAGDGWPHLLYSSTFILNYAGLPFRPVGPGWSLDVEVQYYFVAPLLALLAMRISGGMMLLVTAAVAAVSLVVIHQPVMLHYVPFFCAGLLAAETRWQPGKQLAGLSAGVSIAAVAIVAISPWRDILLGGAHPGPLHVLNPGLNAFVGFLAIPFALYTTSVKSDATDRMMGDLSYVIYLFHWVAVQIISTLAGGLITRLSYTASAWILVFAASWLVWRYYDRPLNIVRSRWVETRSELGKRGATQLA